MVTEKLADMEDKFCWRGRFSLDLADCIYCILVGELFFFGEHRDCCAIFAVEVFGEFKIFVAENSESASEIGVATGVGDLSFILTIANQMTKFTAE